ncbi:MAG: hypothetical protein U9R75_03815 [Candidatus Thermoplasmatota archaeon]|nr:hypothetical protein [Candidatus Thermoplasmatota archaeon]
MPNIKAKENTIDVISPDGGEDLVAGSVKKITWSVSGSSGYISVGYSTNGDKKYEVISSFANNPSHGYGSMDWNIPPTINSTKCRIRVFWVSSLFKPYTVYDQDESDAYFTIEPGVTIKFTEEPSIVSYGKYYLCKYDLYDPDGLVAGLRFEWKTNNGSGWTGWEGLPGYFDWYDPARGWIWWSPSYVESGQCQIRVLAMSKGNVSTLSTDITGIFDIVSPGVTLIQPDGGVTLISATTYTIKWKTSEDPEQVIDDVRLRYSINGGSSWISIGYHDNDFEYDWTVPSIATTELKVQVISIYGEWQEYANDISSSDNRIITSSSTPSVTLIEPNPPVPGGLWLLSGETQMIRYSLTGTTHIDTLTLSYSTNNGSTFTNIRLIQEGFGIASPWTVPAVDTNEGLVRIIMSSSAYPDQTVMSNHPFYIFDERVVNRAPVAMVIEHDIYAGESDVITMDASPSYDPDLDPLTYKWTLQHSAPIEIDLQNPTTATPHFSVDLTNYPVDLVFDLKVEDGYDHSNQTFTYDRDAVNVHVTPRPPVLTDHTPDTGWEGTTLRLRGTDLMGAEILFDGVNVGDIPTVPVTDSPYPDIEYFFTIPSSIEPGVYEISVSTMVGSSTLGGTIEIFPKPVWQLENGLGFPNNSTHTLSYPWNPLGTGRYRDVFDNQVYLNIWVCIGLPYWTPWDGWECQGYLIEEPFAPDPLAAIFYGAVFHHIARNGECFGMSSTALKHYHGDVSVGHYGQSGVSDWSDLEREGEMKRYVQEHQGAQMSAEILNDYLGTLINGLIPSSEISGMGPMISMVKHSIDTEEMGILTMICNEGAHAVVPYAYEDTGDRIRFYVYDSNRAPFSREEDCDGMAWHVDEWNDNPPYIEIERSGTYWDWSFDWTSGTEWSSAVGLGFVPYDTVVGDRTLPLTVEGIFNLLAGSAECSIENEEGNVSGVAEDGSLMWDIPDAAPLPMFGGAGYKPTSYFLPKGNYTTNITGTEDGNYNWSTINNGTSAFSIEDAEVMEGSNDTVSVEYPDRDPYSGVMEYSSDDDNKEYNSSLVHQYGTRFRNMKIIDAELNDDGEHGDGVHVLRANDDYSGIVFENRGGGPTSFDVMFQTNVMSEEVWNGTDRPGVGYLPTATRSGITVGPGETVEIIATDWTDLNNSLIVLGDESVPGEVLNLMINETGGQVNLDWEPPIDSGGWPVQEYKIMRGSSPDDLVSIGFSDSTSFIDNTTDRGNTYYYSVRALNALGPGGSTGSVNITIPVITEPGSPINLFGELVEGEINLTWEPPKDNGGSEITGYIVFKGTSSGDVSLLIEIGIGNGYVDADIDENMTYYYQVAASNSIGQGVLTEEISVFVPAEELPQDDDDDTGDDDGSDGNNRMLYFIIGVVLVILFIVILIFVKRSKEEEGELEEE